MRSRPCGRAESPAARSEPRNPHRPTLPVASVRDGSRPAPAWLRRVRRTFAFVFVGAGSVLTIAKALAPAIVNAQALDVYGGLTLVGVALANGVAIAVMVSAVGHISGGHLNPAVTLGFLVTRRIAPSLAIVYLEHAVRRSSGRSRLAPLALSRDARRLTHLGAPGLTSGVSVWQGLVIEMVLTFFLVWVVFATAADPTAPSSR